MALPVRSDLGSPLHWARGIQGWLPSSVAAQDLVSSTGKGSPVVNLFSSRESLEGRS